MSEAILLAGFEERVAPELARRRRVLVPDLPGHGGSATAAAPEGLWSFADVLAQLAEREQMLPAAVVGHSMGCEVALQLAVRRPEAVSALVLVSASGLAVRTWRARIWVRVTTTLRPSRVVARHRFRVAGSPRLKRVVFGGWGAHDPGALSPEAVLGFLDGSARARDTATAGRALVSSDALGDLGSVSCPTLVVWGARDRLTPLEHGFEYARRLRAPLRTIAGAGHLVISERPSECAALIGEFLESVTE